MIVNFGFNYKMKFIVCDLGGFCIDLNIFK